MFHDTNDFELTLPRWSYAGDGDDAGGDGGSPNAAEGSPGAGGAGKSDDGGNADINKQIQAAVDRATSGLKTNRDQILAEKKQLADQLTAIQSQLETLGGKEGVTKLLEMRERLQKDEMGKLLADGKYDEWYDKRTAALRGDFEQRLEAANSKIAEATEAREKAQQLLARTLLKTEVDAAAMAVEVEKTALDDVRLAAAQVFAYDEELGRHVIKDENGVVLLGKDGATPKGVLEWLEEQRQPKRHWFPPSQGAGANGEVGNHGGAGVTPDAEAISKMSLPEYKKFREKKGMGGVRYGIPG